MRKTRKIIHKVKWQVLEGFFVTRPQVYSRALCNNMYVETAATCHPSGALQWNKVSCKRCLKMRKIK